MDNSELRRLVRLRKKRDQRKRAFEESDGEFKEQQARVHSLMQEEGEKFMRVDLGSPLGEFTFSWRSTPYGRILDIDTAKESLTTLGRDQELLKLAPEKRRLNDFVKDYLERGEPLPEGIDFYTTDYIAIGGLNADANA